jgi:hypothetical protein
VEKVLPTPTKLYVSQLLAHLMPSSRALMWASGLSGDGTAVVPENGVAKVLLEKEWLRLTE